MDYHPPEQFLTKSHANVYADSLFDFPARTFSSTGKIFFERHVRVQCLCWHGTPAADKYKYSHSEYREDYVCVYHVRYWTRWLLVSMNRALEVHRSGATGSGGKVILAME